MTPQKKPIDPRFWAGLPVFVFLLIVLVVYWFIGSATTQKDWVLLYVIIALTTGIGFWTVAPDSTGSLDFKELGIKMGGGAAIGSSFMLLTWWITKDRPDHIPPQRILAIPLGKELLDSQIQVKKFDTEAFENVLYANQHLYTEFKNGHELGWVEIYHSVKGDKARSDKYHLKREKDSTGTMSQLPAPN